MTATRNTGKSISEINRGARRKGADFERLVAASLRPWWPGREGARRSRDNGSRTTADTGDLVGTDERLFWSLKDVAAAYHTLPPGLIRGWLLEATEKSGGRTPLLVVKRRGHKSPLMSWCIMWNHDFLGIAASHTGGWDTSANSLDVHQWPIITELGNVMNLLQAAYYTPLSLTITEFGELGYVFLELPEESP